MAISNPERFSGRVADYSRYRPGYPSMIVGLLEDHCGLSEESLIADIGAGTGMLSELFLANGNTVLAVEPNEEMLAACRTLIERYPRLRVIQGTGEATTLEPESVDFITAGRAFHWFDLPRAHAEFSRVLRPDGWVVIVTKGTRHSTAPVAQRFRKIQRRWRTENSAGEKHYEFGYKLSGFLDERTMGSEQMQEVLTLGPEDLIGYALSMSSTPRRDHPDFAALERELLILFDKYAADGLLRLPLLTEVIYGRLRKEYRAI